MFSTQNERGLPTNIDNDGKLIARVYLFGDLRISVGDNSITSAVNRARKIWSVLAYLLLHRDRTTSQNELIDIFWQDENKSNPSSALKALFSRIRSTLQPILPAEINPILSSNGGYQWNPAIHCEVDTEEFEKILMLGKKAEPINERMELYQRAIDLYKHGFLPSLDGYLWVLTYGAKLNNLYMDAIKAYALLLESLHRYSDMYNICSNAIKTEMLDEGIYILMIRSLLGQGMETAAYSVYENVVELLYDKLGAKPSAELHDLFTQIMHSKLKIEARLDNIHAELQENTRTAPPVFVCDYGYFKEAYRLETRRTSRSGVCTHLALISLHYQDGGTPSLKVLKNTMNKLLNALYASLRNGDIVSRYSATQYVILLYAANYENSIMVMNRVMNAFRANCRRSHFKISYEIRDLRPFE